MKLGFCESVVCIIGVGMQTFDNRPRFIRPFLGQEPSWTLRHPPQAADESEWEEHLKSHRSTPLVAARVEIKAKSSVSGDNITKIEPETIRLLVLLEGCQSLHYCMNVHQHASTSGRNDLCNPKGDSTE
jgi:hypothetical protein